MARASSKPVHVIGLSGGKDSVAMALRLMEVEPRDYTLICNRTGNELPEMVKHWRRLEKLLGNRITWVQHHTDLDGAIQEQGNVPNVFQRWCTRVMKIEPTARYMAELPEGSVLYVGLRADEEARRGMYGEDLLVDFPMRRWGWDIAKVYAYLDERGVTIPERTDCAWCPFQRLGQWKALKTNYPVIWMRGVEIEREQGYTFRSAGRDTWPADLESLGKEFDTGRHIRAYNERKPCRVCTL